MATIAANEDRLATGERVGDCRNESSSGPLVSDQANGSARDVHNADGLVRALGWFSLGLGLAQMAAPRRVAQMAGIEDAQDTEAVIRAVGLREIASGVGILTRSNPTPWLWARVGGDAMDLALLRSAMASPHADHNRLAATTAAVAGIAAVDALCGTRLVVTPRRASSTMTPPQDVIVSAAITVNAPLEQVYQEWAGFQSLPRFIASAATVEAIGEGQTHWRAELPAGLSLEWDVEITESVPNERIAWRTVEGSAVDAAGAIQFRAAPREQGSEILFEARFGPPGGEVGRKIGGLFADVIGTKVQQDLRRFKQLSELGEIVVSDDSIVKGPNPAQPVAASRAA